MSALSAAIAGRAPVPLSLPPRLTKARPAGLPPVPQTGSLTFGSSNTNGVDQSVNVGDVGLSAATTSLTLNLDLQAGRKYTFSFWFRTGGPTVTLTDAKGKKTTVSMANGFTVAKGGTYQLTFSAGYSLKNSANFDNLVINAKSVLPTTSGDTKIDALLTGGTGQWWHAADAAATKGATKVSATANGLAAGSSATALTYSFMSSAPSGQDGSGFQAMTAAQKDAVRQAFAYYGKLINVTFTEVQGGGAGDINFGTNTQASSAGYAYLPNSSGTKGQTYLYLANNVATNGDQGMQPGGYGWETILHEIGHTLGLKHPGNYNAGGGGTPGPYLPASLDNHQYSIMSYKDDNATRGVNATTPMLYDVAALQYLYGANTGSSTAVNGAFAFAPGTSPLETLWSANGTDTIDLSQLTNSSKVDLNAGDYSSINITGSSTSTIYSGSNDVAIAYGSAINHVRLSSASGVAEGVVLNKAYAAGGFDTVDSVDASDDTIDLKKSLFGALTAKNIEFGTAATKSTSRIIVNNATGEIFYDPDGTGKQAAKKIAQYTTLQGSGALSATNFAFVA